MSTVTAQTAPVVRPGKRPGYAEIKFEAKPDAETRGELKAAGFRWNGADGVWWGRADKLPAQYGALPEACDLCGVAGPTQEQEAYGATRRHCAKCYAALLPIMARPALSCAASVADAFGLRGMAGVSMRPDGPQDPPLAPTSEVPPVKLTFTHATTGVVVSATPETPKPKRAFLTCPTCKREGALTIREAKAGYQCRTCTANEEGPASFL